MVDREILGKAQEEVVDIQEIWSLGEAASHVDEVEKCIEARREREKLLSEKGRELMARADRLFESFPEFCKDITIRGAESFHPGEIREKFYVGAGEERVFALRRKAIALDGKNRRKGLEIGIEGRRGEEVPYARVGIISGTGEEAIFGIKIYDFDDQAQVGRWREAGLEELERIETIIQSFEKRLFGTETTSDDAEKATS